MDQESPLIKDALAFAKANWWTFLLGGVLYVLFGVLALVRPAEALLALSVVFASLLLIDGIFSAARALGAKGAEGRWWVFFAGLLSILYNTDSLLFCSSNFTFSNSFANQITYRTACQTNYNSCTDKF